MVKFQTKWLAYLFISWGWTTEIPSVGRIFEILFPEELVLVSFMFRESKFLFIFELEVFFGGMK